MYGNLKQAVWRIYNLVQDELYLNRPDMEVKGVRLNSDLVMGLLFLITDIQITNLEKLITYFNTCRSRLTAVHVVNNEHVRHFRQSLGPNKHVGYTP